MKDVIIVSGGDIQRDFALDFLRNRIERRKASYKLLHGIGMRQGTIVKMCMIEAVRESVWCIFTMPLILILELLMYMRKNLVE